MCQVLLTISLWDQVFEANGELQDVDLGNCKELGSATGYQTEELYETEGAVFGTFKFCRKLISVKFGEELEIINHGTFLSCDSLVGPIEFPANLKKITIHNLTASKIMPFIMMM